MTSFDEVVLKAHALGIKFVPKTGRFWQAINRLLVILSFGKMDRFLTDFFTTIGPVIAMPARCFNTDGTLKKGSVNVNVLVHEMHHVDQFKRAGFGNAWAGVIPAGLVYLLLPLPIGLAYGRYVMERAAYVAGFRHQIAFDGGDRELLIEFAVDQLAGPNYLWTWPFKKSVRAWFNRELPPGEARGLLI